ncbi:MAG: FGGY-family carbohydrate kinase [Planctomycetaceae bacterium]|jgi:xylulokinase|nr:FGGY-family carbohydrate kinase [Planctomycetaceae bacterium]
MSEETKKANYVIGVDLGPESVTAMAVSDSGDVLLETTCAYDFPKNTLPKGRSERNPEIWWNAVCYALGHLGSQWRMNGHSDEDWAGISVTGSAGNLVILDRKYNPLMPAIMAEDQRAAEQAMRLSAIGNEHCQKIGTPFKGDDVISKIVWVKEEYPDIYENAIFVHQPDYILGLLKGSIDVTDPTAARQSGYDLFDNCWPDWLDYDMHLSVRERLPKVLPHGTLVGRLTPAVSKSLSLPAGLPVILGGTSQMAEFIASGVKQIGDFYTQFDDAMQISGICNNMFYYPHGIVKLNRLTMDNWFFSTSMNTGTEWINVWFNEQLANEYTKQVDSLLPSHYIAYPNVRKGELFPFCSNSAEGFISPATDNRPVQFASCLQGTALSERLAYQYIDKACDNTNIGQVYTYGKWCRSDLWMQCRANVTERVVHRLARPNVPAFGAAMIAAIGTVHKTLQRASDTMVRIDQSFYPNPEKMLAYKDHFLLFQKTMQEQGYLI